MIDPALLQQQYYKETAEKYDEMHIQEADEHFFALTFMLAAIDFLQVKSVLDIGSGTGRALHMLKRTRPGIRVLGIEPSAELRAQGHRKGLSPEELIDGDAQKLRLGSGEFDLVCEFGALHHIPEPASAVNEMLRVASRAIFISDSNNFGQGSALARTMKQIINMCGLWGAFDYIKTRGKGYSISDGDGLAYSYSVFNNYKEITKTCQQVHLLNTLGSGVNIYRSCSHVALLGIK